MEDLIAVSHRFRLAQMAVEDAIDAGNGWDGPKLNALLESWRDVAELHDEVMNATVPADDAEPLRDYIRRVVREEVREALNDHDGRLHWG